MQQCTAEEVERMLPLVSRQRCEEALRFRHLQGRYACLKSYLMLHDMLVDEGIICKGEELSFVRNEHGKPSLEGYESICFNISHCKSAIAVAIDNTEIGIDVERFRTPSEGLLRYTMSDEEISIIQESDYPDRTFAAYWTKKEALFKYLGTGIRGDIPHLLDSTPSDVVISTVVLPEKGYAYSVAQNLAT